MSKVYTDESVSLDVLKNKTIGVIGYGSQGRAQALNLRDSDLNVIIGLRKGKSWSEAAKDGFMVYEIDEAAKRSDVLLMLIPDMVQQSVWSEYVSPHVRPGTVIDFAHGFNVRFGLIKLPDFVDVVMVAPKGPGKLVRDEYVRGRGVPALVAVHQNYSGVAMEYALAIAKGIGATRMGVLETTFAEETETDLIGEQTVLVGGLIELLKKGFEVLVELGYQPEVAYFEAINEAKLIMDLIWEKGFTGMLMNVSETARFGGLTVGSQVIDDHVKENMKKAAEKVRNNEFARLWVKEYKEGMSTLTQLIKEIEKHQVEVTGKYIRSLASGRD
ncbi:MAG: ketol-acid reductoisomerase [Thermoprotei archaeon]